MDYSYKKVIKFLLYPFGFYYLYFGVSRCLELFINILKNLIGLYLLLSHPV